MKYNAVGLGEVLWDLLPGGKQLGGAPENFAYHFKALAGGMVDSYVVSSVGKDPLGDEILKRLGELSLNVENVFIDAEHETGVVNVEIDSSGAPSYRIKEGVAWDYISNVSETLAQSSSVVCFGSLAQRFPISKNSIQSFVSKTTPESLRIFDINLRQHYYDHQCSPFGCTLGTNLAASALIKHPSNFPVIIAF